MFPFISASQSVLYIKLVIPTLQMLILFVCFLTRACDFMLYCIFEEYEDDEDETEDEEEDE